MPDSYFNRDAAIDLFRGTIDMDSVEILLKEYQTIRDESLQAVRSQQLIVQIGLPSTAVLTGFGLQAAETVESVLICAVLVPLLVRFLTIIWAGEVVRMARAGAYLVRLEARLSELSSGGWPLQWETRLAQQDPLTIKSAATYGNSQPRVLMFTGAASMLIEVGLLMLHSNFLVSGGVFVATVLFAIYEEFWIRRLIVRIVDLSRRALHTPLALPSVGSIDDSEDLASG